MTHKRLTLFAGHYGSGKTNIALNYARWLRRKGEAVTVADAGVGSGDGRPDRKGV